MNNTTPIQAPVDKMWNPDRSHEVYWEYRSIYKGGIFEYAKEQGRKDTTSVRGYIFYPMFCFVLGHKQGRMIRILEGNI